MIEIKTRLTEKYGTPHPFTLAGMAFAGEKPELSIAVNKAGGIGCIGVGFMQPERLRETIRALRDADVELFNINFITFFGNEEQVKVVAEEKVPIVSFHWGHPPEDQISLLKAAGCDLWVQVGSVADAEAAVGYGADVIIAQGHESGGHNYQGLGSMALTPAIVDAVGDKALVLAAGGIADGRGVAAALSLGADGVWVGTRLVASEEAHVHPEHHRRLLEADGTDTTFSAIFGPEWPEFNPMRLLKTCVVEEWNHRLEEVPMERDDLEVIGETVFLDQPHTKRKFDVILPTPETAGDFEEMAWLSGQGVGLIKSIEPAETIVRSMMEGAAKIMSENAARVSQ